MAINLATSYPGKITVDAGNPNGTFKNRTSDALKDGTPYEKKWSSDVWGFLAHILGLASVAPSGAEENETNSQYYDALEGLVGRRAVEFETSRDLVFNFTSVTEAQATFSRMSLLDSNYIPKYLDNQTLVWDITVPGILEAGTSEKISTDYGAWVDSDGNLVLAPDLESITDGTTAGKLVDSGATFLTDLVHAGDIAYNLRTKLKTTVSIDATLNGEVSVTDDIFISGDDYKIVKMSPVGLGANRERLATVFNNAGSDFDDSYYTQIQEEKSYSEADGDFILTLTGATLTTVRRTIATIKQINDWTGTGHWFSSIKSAFNVNPVDLSFTISLSGMVFKGGTDYNQAVTVNSSGLGDIIAAEILEGTGDIDLLSNTARGTFNFGVDPELAKKPTFHN